MKNTFVPDNIEGKQNDITTSQTFNTVEEAERSFYRACKRLLNPPIWHDLAGDFSASFTLVNADGVEQHRLVMVNDYFKVNIPGPATQAGDNYDWVQVKAIDDHSDDNAEPYIAMRIRPSSNPLKKEEGTAHFFKSLASSSFIVSIEGNKVSASYHGRNEMINTDTGNFTDKVRNTIVATGAFAGLSEMQWSALIKALLQPEIGE